MIKSAKGHKGFLLYNPITKQYFFRIYDPDDKSKFTDYDLCAEDIEVEILSSDLELYEKPERNRLDYSRKALGHNESN
jgi:hypothetical protein